MGWKIDEKEAGVDTRSGNQAGKKEEEPEKGLYHDLHKAYKNLKGDYEKLKEEVNMLKRNSDVGKDVKNIKQMNKEMRFLKEDYKQCVETLKKK